MRQPIVAIVGRPNVGKSTLFNRILKKREAIVDDVPGVTRDRHYARTDWSGKSFILIDTGGYLPQATELMERAIREQVEIAIEEADLLLFVVDQTTGVTDVDRQIAERLKRTEKPVLLLVNKVDHANLEAEAYQFYGLGIGEPIFISALQGRGIGDMLDVLHRQLDSRWQEEGPDDRIKVAVVGKENVGKSSFINTLLGEKRVIVTPVPGTTRDPIDTPVRYRSRRFLLIDTAGLKRKTRIKENLLFYSQLRTMRSIDRADVVVYFVDATVGLTRQDLRILAESVDARKAVILVVNKWDLIPKDAHTLAEWEQHIRKRLGTMSYIPILFISVLQKKRLYKLMDMVLEVFDQYHQTIKTSELNRVLLPIIEANSPPAVRGKEVKINYITQVETAPPRFLFFGNRPDRIPTNYRRFLERKIREHWKFKGVPIMLSFRSKHS